MLPPRMTLRPLGCAVLLSLLACGAPSEDVSVSDEAVSIVDADLPLAELRETYDDQNYFAALSYGESIALPVLDTTAGHIAFEGKKGDRVDLRVDAAGGHPLAFLLGNGYEISPNPGYQLFAKSDSGRIVLELPKDGMYMFVFRDRDRARVPFTVRIGLEDQGLPLATAIAAGQRGTCVLREDGRIKCWGDLPDRTFWDSGVRATSLTAYAGGERSWTEPAPSSRYISDRWCATLIDGRAMCTRKYEGIMTRTFSAARPITKAVPGGHHTCALLDDGRVACFGDNRFGQLGLGYTVPREVAMTDALTAVDLRGKKAIDLVAGTAHTCALLEDRSVMCWGLASHSAAIFDTGHHYDVEARPSEIFLGAGRSAKIVAAGEDSTCIVKDDDDVLCWTSGARPNGHYPSGMVKVPAGAHPISLTLRNNHRCVVLDNGDATCSGDNRFGELGVGNTETIAKITPSYPRIDLGAGLVPSRLVLGDGHTCALLIDGRVKCWGGSEGFHSYGVLGTRFRDRRGDEPGEMGDALPFSDLSF